MLKDVFKQDPNELMFKKRSNAWYEQEKTQPEFDAVHHLTEVAATGRFEPGLRESYLAAYWLRRINGHVN